MISNRPYLIRAMNEWILDNEWTPNVQVDAHYPNVDVPQEFVNDGMIVLNIHPDAVHNLRLENNWFGFQARFGGVERKLGFPPEAILSIFSSETGHGMPFPPEPYSEATEQPEENASDFTKPRVKLEEYEDSPYANPPAKPKRKKSHLSIVK